MTLVKRVFLDNSGKIISSIEGDAQVVVLNTPSNAIFVDNINYQQDSDYWDFDLFQFVPLGSAPSQYHVFNYTTKEWYDPRTLDELKTEKWTELKRQRDMFEFGGFTWNGGTYDSDRTSQSRIIMASLSDAPQTWTLADNSAVDLTAAELTQLAAALREHIAIAHARGRSAREALEAATSADEVNSVVF